MAPNFMKCTRKVILLIQSNSPVDFRTLPVDCQNFLALTAVLALLCVVVAKKQCEQILATIHIRLYEADIKANVKNDHCKSY